MIHRIRRDHDHHLSLGVFQVDLCQMCSQTRSQGFPSSSSFCLVGCPSRAFAPTQDHAPRSVGTVRQFMLHSSLAFGPWGFACCAVRLAQVRLVLFSLQVCASSRVPSQRGSRLVPVDHCVLSNSDFFLVSWTTAPFSWTMSKPWALSSMFAIFWSASSSWVLILPQLGLEIVIAPTSALFFTCSSGRVASVTSKFIRISVPPAACNLASLRVPLCRRGSPNTPSKFNFCPLSTV